MRRFVLLFAAAGAAMGVAPVPGVRAAVSPAIQFAPATITSAHFLGGEPMQSMERPLANSLAGAINPDRIFVDSIFGFGNGTSTLSRSLDHGDTFRPLIDLTCANRNRPTCQTNGGGDVVDRVNLYDGTVYFGDQEAVATESLASSIDHGDTWPAPRQFLVGNSNVPAVDRQWIATVNKPGYFVTPAGQSTPVELRAFYEYHVPAVGSYVQGIDANGIPIPQPAPQLSSVGQSHFTRVDSDRGYIYQPYWETVSGTIHIQVAKISDYLTSAGWHDHTITTDSPALFVGFNLDTAGNAYAAWTPSTATGGRAVGKVYLSYSSISDATNNPVVGGLPGTTWSNPVDITDAGIGSSAFVEVVAGDPGRIAVHYLGTADATGSSDLAANGSRWDSYVAFITGANTATPTVTTAQADHRVMHTGSICTSGTTCLGDRSLADTQDIGVDANGCVGVNWEDNNNQLARDKGSTNASSGQTIMGNAFTHYAMEVQGPSLFTGKPDCSRIIPTDTRVKSPGTATWPNTSSGTNLPALDVLNTTIVADGTDLVGRINLSDASATAMANAITNFNAVPSTGVPATRLLYVLRFSTAYVDATHQGETDFLAMEFTPPSTLKFLGEKIDGDDALTSGAGTGGPAYRGASYHADSGFTITGSITGNTIEIHGLLSQFGVGAGTPLYSVTAFGMAGPPEATEVDVKNLMRTVGVTAPFDTALGPGANIPEAPQVAALLLVGLGALLLAAAVRRRAHGKANQG